MTRLFEAKPFIICEIGSNWTTLPECLASIASAKRCGADAAKFQAFNHEALYGIPRRRVSPIEKSPEYYHELPLAWLPKLKAMADEQGIEFMCTAFSPELVAAVDPYVSVHKIASSDANCPQMLEAVAKTGKPCLISTGARSVIQDVFNAEVIFRPNKPLFLSCTATYPADFTEVGAFDGLSDHTMGYTATVEAARRGAIVIEKHFTAFPDLDTPDRPHSLNPTQFKRMVDIIRDREVESEETAMFLRHKRRLIATKEIAPGETLRFGVNFGAYRSLEDDTRGASPFDWEKVNGRMAKGLIARGKGIALGDCE